MARYVRLSQSAVDPADMEQVRQRFDGDLRKVLLEQDGCTGVQLLINVEQNAGGLADGAVCSWWDSLESMEEAFERADVTAAASRMRELLRMELVTKTLEVHE